MMTAFEPAPSRLVWRSRHELDCDGGTLQVGLNPKKLKPEYIQLLKTPRMTKRYMRQLQSFEARNVVDLGIWKGGSVVFLWNLFALDKLVAIDRSDGAPDLESYVARMGLQEKLKCFFNTSQDNRPRLTEIVEAEFGAAPLDLVIDDASHLYAPTKDSFEVLFPRLRPGGKYVIEDWRAYEVYVKDQEIAPGDALQKLIFELVMLFSSDDRIIEHIDVQRESLTLTRGDAPLTPGAFSIDDLVRNENVPPLSALF